MKDQKEAKNKKSTRIKGKENPSQTDRNELLAEEILSEKGDQEANQKHARFYGVDIPFLVLSLLLLAIGLVMMYSASFSWSLYKAGSPSYYISRQILFAGLGIIAAGFITFLDYRIWKSKLVLILFSLVTFVFLIMVNFYGEKENGATRWLNLGFFTLQPSELAKVWMIVMLSSIYSFHGEKSRGFVGGVLPLVLIVMAIDVFLIMQSHVSALLLVTLTGAAIALYAGVKLGWIAAGGILGGTAVWFLISKVEKFGYIRSRIAIFQDPFSDALGNGYQTVQSIYAISSGGVWGVGLGNSMQKLEFLPECQNDYVFSIVCEELGMFGAVLIILLFAAFIICGFRIAIRVKDMFGKLLVSGIMTLLALQVFLNIMVVTNAFPVTGVSLPFFSYGGTSLLIIMAEVGIVLSVSRQSKKLYRKN